MAGGGHKVGRNIRRGTQALTTMYADATTRFDQTQKQAFTLVNAVTQNLDAKWDEAKGEWNKVLTEQFIKNLHVGAEEAGPLLAKINQEGTVHALTVFLKEFDPARIAGFDETNKRLAQTLLKMEELKTLEVITKAFDNLNSISEWISYHKDTLEKLAAGFACAAIAYQILTPIVAALGMAAELSNKNAYHKQVMDRIDLITAHTLEQSRLLAGRNVQEHLFHSPQPLTAAQQAQLDEIYKESVLVLENTPTVDTRVLKKVTDKFINGFYIEAGEDLEDLVTPLAPSLQALSAVINDKMENWPAHNGTLMTYSSLLRTYDPTALNDLMHRVKDIIAANGGDRFYYEKLVDEPGSREAAFLKFMGQVNTPLGTPHLSSYAQDIQASRLVAIDLINDEIEGATSDIRRTIFNRAMLQYCKETSAYFRGILRLSAELKSGVRSAYNNCASPMETLTGLFDYFNLRNAGATRRRVNDHIINHIPGVSVEFTGTGAAAAATGAAVVVGAPVVWDYARRILGPDVVNAIAVGSIATAVTAAVIPNLRPRTRFVQS